MNISQSKFKWLDEIPGETKNIVSGYVREAEKLVRSKYGALQTIPALVSCLCTDYYYERETLLENKQSEPQSPRLCLDASRTKAAFDCGFGHQSRELLGSTVTNPSFRGSYKWKVRIVCADPDIGISADFGIHTEFEHPDNGRRVEKTYNIEANQTRPEVDRQSVNAKGMKVDLELDTVRGQFTVTIDGWSQWEEEYVWPVFVDKSYCVRMAMHCKGTLELLDFKQEAASKNANYAISDTI